MTVFYYSGINCSSLFTKNEMWPVIIEQFQEIPFENLTRFEIGWNFSLLWRNAELYISGKINVDNSKDCIELLKIPDFSGRYKDATAGGDYVDIITEDDQIWRFKVYEKTWTGVPKFLSHCEDGEKESVVQMLSTRCTFVLTNLGRIFSVPVLIDMPKRIKFVQIAGGFEHTLMLTEEGQVYSMGIGRGELGHGDLNDYEHPTEIQALAGLKVVQISAGGWHSAVITNEGDLYTWGWNVHGELGLQDSVRVCAVPQVVDFKNQNGENVEINVKKVDCGDNFTICLMDDGTLWGCGSNKYGQLGQSVKNVKTSDIFIKLNLSIVDKNITDFKCRGWGTCIIAN